MYQKLCKKLKYLSNLNKQSLTPLPLGIDWILLTIQLCPSNIPHNSACHHINFFPLTHVLVSLLTTSILIKSAYIQITFHHFNLHCCYLLQLKVNSFLILSLPKWGLKTKCIFLFELKLLSTCLQSECSQMRTHPFWKTYILEKASLNRSLKE